MFSSVQLCLTLCDPMDCNMPGLPVHPQLPEFTQTLSIKSVMPSNLLILCRPLLLHLQSFPASGSFQMSQFFHQVAKVLEFQLQHQSFQWIFTTNFLYNGLVGSPCSPRDSQESSSTPQFESIYSFALSFLYSPTPTSIHDYWKNHSFD